MDRKRVYVDMDHVLCDFEKSFKAIQMEYPEIVYPQSDYGFFANLEPIDGAISAFRELEKHYDTYILTAPSVMNPLCYTEKRVWVEKYFDLEVCNKLILACDKSLLIGDYLIDDIVHEGFMGEHIHFATPQFPDWKTVLDYLLPK